MTEAQIVHEVAELVRLFDYVTASSTSNITSVVDQAGNQIHQRLAAGESRKVWLALDKMGKPYKVNRQRCFYGETRF